MPTGQVFTPFSPYAYRSANCILIEQLLEVQQSRMKAELVTCHDDAPMGGAERRQFLAALPGMTNGLFNEHMATGFYAGHGRFEMVSRRIGDHGDGRPLCQACADS